MYHIDGTTISLTRGDTLMVQVSITRDQQPYTPVEGDSVRFALKSGLNARGTDFKEQNPLILKTIPIDTMILRLDPEDTKPLPFGVYKYDIEITFADGKVDTFITASDFNLTPEVH